MSTYESQCFLCKNYYKKQNDENPFRCKAFEDGIPKDILFNEFIHTKKHPKQDNNILFEPIEKAKV